MFKGILSLSIGNPIPFIPFPLARGRGRKVREASPLLNTPIIGEV
jgi:hypothetical protein